MTTLNSDLVNVSSNIYIYFLCRHISFNEWTSHYCAKTFTKERSVLTLKCVILWMKLNKKKQWFDGLWTGPFIFINGLVSPNKIRNEKIDEKTNQYRGSCSSKLFFSWRILEWTCYILYIYVFKVMGIFKFVFFLLLS